MTSHAEDYFDHVAALRRQCLNQDGSEMASRYQCISLPNSSEHHVEDKVAHRRANMWIIPGTYPDDPAFAQAGAMACYARSHRTNYWLRDYP